MRRRVRFGLAGLCAAVAIAAGASLAVLRSGRPLYYSDGKHLVRADALADRPMQVFERPLPQFELPGPVRGRFAALGDGRIVYGRARGDDRTELVLFDPREPTAEPIGLALSDDGHDFAPCIDAAGDLLFTSDRPGGAGGFDIWRARTLGDGRFAPPIVLGENINSPADEVDPALAPDGRGIVFARRIPDVRATALYIADLESDLPASPLWGDRDADPLAQFDLIIDREPVFAPDGAWLWFVRERAGLGKTVLGAPRFGDGFGAPLPEPILAEGGRFRSPLPDGFGVRLLADGSAALVYRADARLLRPWWEGQLELERLLWWIFAASLLLLLLLLLGARWRALDVVTWCVLLSLLVHLLLWWLLHSVLLPEAEPSLPGDGERIALTMIDGAEAAAAEAAAAGDPGVRASQAERPDRASLTAAAAPSSAIEAAVAAARESVELDRALPDAAAEHAASATAAMQDAPAEIAPSAGADALPASELGIAPAALAARAAAARSKAVTADESAIVVHAPSGANLLEAAASARSTTAAAPDIERSVPSPTSGGVLVPVVADAVDAVAPTAADSRGLTPLATQAGGARSTPRAAAASAERRVTARDEPIGQGVSRTNGAPGTELRAVGSPTHVDIAALVATAAPTPRALATGSNLRDAPTAVADATATSADAAQLARAAPSLADLGPRAVDAVASRAQPATAAAVVIQTPDHAPDSALPTAATASGASLPELVTDHRAPLVARGPSPAAALRDAPRPGSPNAAVGPTEASPSPSPSRDLGPLALRAVVPSSLARPGRSLDPAIARVRAPGSSLPAAPRGKPDTAAPTLARSDLAALYGNRFGPRKASAIERFGGNAETEAAVAKGLEYLASIQDERGHWGRKSREHSKYGEVWVGKTALCTLAFLGAGHTARSNTRYSDNVARAIDSLLDVQGEDSAHFGDTTAYSHGIATYALAECLAISGDVRLRRPVERAVLWILQNQNDSRDRRSRGGWGYFSATRRPEDSYARTSTTVWQVMALESAKISGIEVPDAALAEARGFLRGMFDDRLGAFLYNREPSRLRSNWPTLPASTPAAVFCLLLLGDSATDRRIVAGLDYTLSRRPKRWRDASEDAFVLRAEGHPYFWYCGTLAAFLAGGDAWQTWNESLKRVFLPAQNQDGSFTPIGAYAEYADDRPNHAAFTTALAVLSLEVYYRYVTPLLEPR